MKPILHGHLDSAEIEITSSETLLRLRGWFLRETDTIKLITFYYGESSFQTKPQPRSDVAERIKAGTQFLNVGYEVALPLTYIPAHSKHITISFEILFGSGEVYKSYLTAVPQIVRRSHTQEKSIDSPEEKYSVLSRIKLNNFLAHPDSLTFPSHENPKPSSF